MNIYNKQALEGMTILVTGASSGIGSASAKLLSSCGATLILSGRDTARLNEVSKELAGVGHVSHCASLDSADEAYEWAKLVLQDHGPIAGLLHCAGVEMIRPIRTLKQAQLSEVFASSLFASFGLARALSAKNAIVDGGSIVFMSSVAGTTGQSGLSAYSASKAGIDGLMRSLACEVAARRIRVNSIVAGAVQTPMHTRICRGGTEESTLKYERSHLLGFGDAIDVANAALYLLSPASRWVTGTSMVVDGGFLAR